MPHDTDSTHFAARRSAGASQALWVVLAGVCAAMHVGKLPPAVPALQQALGIDLIQAGFLLSVVQLAGMVLGIALGTWADVLGPRRSVLGGLCLLGASSLAGAAAAGWQAMLSLRALEGLGFLMVVLGAPAWVRQLVAPHQLTRVMGVWSAYMPTATAVVLLLGPVFILHLGWRAWWAALGMASVLMVAWLWRCVPGGAPEAQPGSAPGLMSVWRASMLRLRLTLAAPGPWLVALAFAVYSGQWLAVLGFLPTIVQQVGWGPGATGLLTALVAGINILGNLAAGRALHLGVAPWKLLSTGYAAMAVGAAVAYWGLAHGPPPAALLTGANVTTADDGFWLLRYVGLLGFSAIGGLVPGTLFNLAIRLAPGPGAVSTSVGWMLQGSSAGQFAGPPLVAWLASRVGGWHYTWVATGLAALAGLCVTFALARRLRRPPG